MHFYSSSLLISKVANVPFPDCFQWTNSLKIKLMNEYVVRKVDHGKNVNNKGRIDTVPSNA